MKNLLAITGSILAAVAVTGATAHVHADSAKIKPGRYPEKAAAWHKNTLQDVALGSALTKVSGFVCDGEAASGQPPKYRRTCVKFLDDRCKSRETKVGSVGTSADLPPGQNCFLEVGMGGTYLDRKFMSPPLSRVMIVGTDTTSPVVYEISMVVAADDLTDSTNLGKALLAKYGRPSYTQPPTQMMWKDGDVQVSASCRSTQGPTGEYCTITVSDTALLDAERGIQQAADIDQQHKQAPSAPKL